MSRRDDYERFFEAARTIARSRDTQDSRLISSHLCGCLIDGEEAGLCSYKDDVVEIVAGKEDQRLSVELVENKNPVICIYKDKGVIRTHGEMWDVEEHVLKLANPLRLLGECAE